MDNEKQGWEDFSDRFIDARFCSFIIRLQAFFDAFPILAN